VLDENELAAEKRKILGPGAGAADSPQAGDAPIDG
jgi:hypothetical protein